MKFKNLKRKLFFWVEKLQISKAERIAFTLMLGVLGGSFLLHLYLKKSYNYSQQQYDDIVEEFEKRSTEVQQMEEELEAKYNPDEVVNSTPVSKNVNTDQKQEPSASAEVEAININTAGSSQLQQLNGIGPAYADRIIEYREANGGFDSIDELVNVKGIGEKRLENIRPFIKLD